MKSCFSLIFFLLIVEVLPAQVNSIVFFKDKEGSNYSLENPSNFLSQKSLERRVKQGIEINDSDLPVSKIYLNVLKENGSEVVYTSKWLNGALIRVEDQIVLDSIMKLGFVSGKWEGSSYVSINDFSSSSIKNKNEEISLKTSIDYGNSFNQLSMLGIDLMHELGFTGEGLTIGVIDAGFRNLDSNPFFEDIEILDTYDFVEGESNVYNDHDHGLKVLSVISSYKEGSIVGGAFDVDLLLYKTEDVSKESKLEEFFWLVAAERADSVGVDIINSSLGYARSFTDSTENYNYEQLDGEQALITKAANMASSKGILVVTSAGNEGANSWQKITAPSDGDNVLSVGAVTSRRTRANFSSIGPTFDGRIKPDVSALGEGVVAAGSNNQLSLVNGTSVAAPIMTSFAAGIWQAFPNLTNLELIELIKSSGNRFDSPNNQIGYGVPSFFKAYSFLTSTDEEGYILSKKEVTVFPNPIKKKEFTVTFMEGFRGKVIVKIYSIDGKQILLKKKQIANGNSFKINLPGLLEGLYLCNIQFNNKRLITKLVIQN